MVEPNLRIDLVRHGPTVNRGAFNGMSDVGLDPKLIEKSKQYFLDISKNWQLIISSPLKRCLTPAKKIAAKNNIPLIIEERIREYDFGDWEGKLPTEIAKESKFELNAFLTNPYECPPPNGEDLTHFEDRVNLTLNEISIKKENNIGILCHGGVIRAVLANKLNIPIQETLPLKIDYLCKLSLDLWNEKDIVWQISGIHNVNL